MGEGMFILPLDENIRKATRKNAGATLRVRLEHHKDYVLEIPANLQECFDFEPGACDYFNSLSKSHQAYFIKWINDAKTESTRTNRIVSTINATVRGMHYGQMLQEMKKERER